MSKEADVLDKILLHFTENYSKKFDKACMMFQKKINPFMTKEQIEREFLYWFLLRYEIRPHITPMMLAYSHLGLDESERLIVKNFLNNLKGLFEIVSIDGKDYLLKDAFNKKSYLVKTIDMESNLKKGDFVFATLVKRFDKDYFFYGNASQHSRSEGLLIKKDMENGFSNEMKLLNLMKSYDSEVIEEVSLLKEAKKLGLDEKDLLKLKRAGYVFEPKKGELRLL